MPWSLHRNVPDEVELDSQFRHERNLSAVAPPLGPYPLPVDCQTKSPTWPEKNVTGLAAGYSPANLRFDEPPVLER